ncbi:hypothetical protein PUNSTDRAFT_83434 [Punctularia strigosozonata HHB-11173 SS5]|uniref:uncharacterized protein n=1 Tax=Punctularia strigosozonata (strain HHB-11173) TaxID=741275 RepID=UPI0004417CEB|nr:uncharacterized protein PUNSTDRAFT_83434 [Punctularia strigosozonata HHB-11173 SS5]EIN11712.1 hypothetical protein PUNSTDRAFT_83434 [Punctularia strigosozonata HHB-11173 SS5]
MALKASYLFKPLSRPSSPAPPTTAAPMSRSESTEARSRPLTKLSLSNFSRKSSPAPPPARTSPPAVQEGSTLEMLSLKFSEAVSKALTQPPAAAGATDVVNGRRPLPAGRGKALGNSIAHELDGATGNAQLRRAIIRSLHRPLSVMLTMLSSHVMPLISSPSFQQTLLPTVQAPNPPPIQQHALGYASFAGELLDTFDDLGLGVDIPGDFRGDGLKGIREGLASVLGKILNPMIQAMKDELAPLIESLEKWVPATSTSASNGLGTKPKGSQLHQSMVTLQAIVPLYAKTLSRYTTPISAQGNLAPFLISLIWRGMVALTHRPIPLSLSRSTTPTNSPSGFKKGRALSMSVTTPPPTPPLSGRFGLKLPPSRPPSPPSPQFPKQTPAASDAKTLFTLLNAFPKPDAERSATKVAREAVDDAFDALTGLILLLESVQTRASLTMEDLDDLEFLTEDPPTLISLQVLLAAYVFPPPPALEKEREKPAQPAPTIASMVGLSEEDYRQGCLGGFGRAEQCAALVGQKVLDVLQANTANPNARVVARWLELQLEEDGAEH